MFLYIPTQCRISVSAAPLASMYHLPGFLAATAECSASIGTLNNDTPLSRGQVQSRCYLPEYPLRVCIQALWWCLLLGCVAHRYAVEEGNGGVTPVTVELINLSLRTWLAAMTYRCPW